jgi:hypothetical protein
MFGSVLDSAVQSQTEFWKITERTKIFSIASTPEIIIDNRFVDTSSSCLEALIFNSLT